MAVKTKFYLFLAFILGLIPALMFIHIVAQDIGTYFYIADSLIRFRSYAFSEFSSPAGIVLTSRPPLLPWLFACSMSLFGRNLFALYLPLFLARIAIIPAAFLTARFFLADELAFLAASLLIFFPKLQLFALSDFETDSFVLLLLLGVMFFYYSAQKTKKLLSYLLCGFCLAALFLAKETGEVISLGVVLAIILETGLAVKKFFNKRFALIMVPYIATVIAFCSFAWSRIGLLQLSAYVTERSLSFLPANLLTYLKTIILYTGLEELYLSAPFKALLVNIFILLLLIAGFLYFLIKKQFILIIPSLVLLFSLGLVRPEDTSSNIPASFQLITILAFVMPLVAIFIFKGLDLFNRHVVPFKLAAKIVCLLLMFKFVNNFFTNPHYLLEFAGEYYINMTTVLTNKTSIPYTTLLQDSQGRYVRYRPKGALSIYEFMKTTYSQGRVQLFTPLFKLLLIIPVAAGLIYALIM